MPDFNTSEEKKPQGGEPVKKIDPTSSEGVAFLNKVLPREEAKGKDAPKDKVFKTNREYSFADHTSPVMFSKPFFRIKKPYDYVEILSPHEDFPLPKKMLEAEQKGKPSVLYFKKTESGVVVSGIHEGRVKSETLPLEKVNDLEKNWGFDFQPSKTEQIEDTLENHKKISAAMRICGFARYVYRPDPIQNNSTSMGAGTFGKVFSEQTGQLERIEGGLRYVLDVSPKAVKYIPLKSEPVSWLESKEQKQAREQGEREKAMSRVRAEGAFGRQADRRQKKQEKKGIDIQKPTIDKEGEMARIVMDDIGTCDLHTFFEKGKAASLDSVQWKTLITNLIQALEDLHDAGVVHGDIKPKNIRINENTLALEMVDFGEARKKEDKNPLVRGTTYWLSPESYAAPERVDERHDVYSLGVLLRGICRDIAHQNRDQIYADQFSLFRDQGWRDYLALEYFLDVPVQEVCFSEKTKAVLGPPWERIARVLTGMTATHPDERLSLKRALSILNEPPEEKEEKREANRKVKSIEDLRLGIGGTIYCYFSFDTLSEKAKRDILHRLVNKRQGLIPAGHFLESVCSKICEQAQNISLDFLTDLTMLTRDVLFGVQYEVTKENVVKWSRELQEISEGKKAVAERLKQEDPGQFSRSQAKAQIKKNRLAEQQEQNQAEEQEIRKLQQELAGLKRQREEANKQAEKEQQLQQLQQSRSKGWTEAWNDTFLAGRTPEQCKSLTKTDHFLNFIGFPPNPHLKFPPKSNRTFWSVFCFFGKGVMFGIALCLWLFCLGPVVIKNIVKLVIELPLKRASDKWGFPFNVLHWVVRAVTSPIINYKQSWAHEKWGFLLGPASLVISGVGLIGIVVAMGPLIAATLPGWGLAVSAHSPPFVGELLNFLGYTVTPKLVGSTVLSMLWLFAASGVDLLRGESRAFPPPPPRGIAILPEESGLQNSLDDPGFEPSILGSHQRRLSENLLTKTFRSSRSVQGEEGDLKEEGGRPTAPNSPSLPSSPMREQSEARVEPQSSSQDLPSFTQHSPSSRRGSS